MTPVFDLHHGVVFYMQISHYLLMTTYLSPRGASVFAHLRKFLLLACVIAFPGMCQAALFVSSWRPISEEDKNMTAPQVDPDAGAEILLRELKIEDNWTWTKKDLYVRIKVFDERGVELIKNFHIDCHKDEKVNSIKAQVLRPDGTVVALEKGDVFEREVFDEGDKRVRRYSYAYPGLVPGSIVEYQLHAVREGFANETLVNMGARLPIHKSVFMFKPPVKDICVLYSEHMLPEGMEKSNWSDYWTAEVNDVPAFPDRRLMPPVLDLMPWVAIHYEWHWDNLKRDNYWSYYSRYLAKQARYKVKVSSGVVKSKAIELTRGVDGSAEKLRCLYNFCTTQRSNIEEPGSGYSMIDIDKMDKNDSASETLSTGRGTENDINILFGAMASALGFDVNIAWCNNRNRMAWNINYQTGFMVPQTAIVIKENDKLNYYQPGRRFVPFGMMNYGNEETVAVIGNEEKAEYALTTSVDSSKSMLIRKADLVLDEEGNISGEVRMRYTGHKSHSLRSVYMDLSDDDRESRVIDAFREQVGGAELTDIQFLNLEDMTKDPELRFKVKVSGYADIVDERIFFEPVFFEKSVVPMLSEPTREYDMCFPYKWESRDVLRIRYPENCTFQPGGEPQSVIDDEALGYVVKVIHSEKDHSITLARNFKVNVLKFPASIYDQIKTIFDAIALEDHRILSLTIDEDESEGE